MLYAVANRLNHVCVKVGGDHSIGKSDKHTIVENISSLEKNLLDTVLLNPISWDSPLLLFEGS